MQDTQCKKKNVPRSLLSLLQQTQHLERHLKPDVTPPEASWTKRIRREKITLKIKHHHQIAFYFNATSIKMTDAAHYLLEWGF